MLKKLKLNQRSQLNLNIVNYYKIIIFKSVQHDIS